MQHDFTIADAAGQPIRLDLQNALQALATCSSGGAPATPYPGMLWLDTSVLPDGALKMRDLTNTTWLNVLAGFPAKASSAETIAGTDDAKFVTPKDIADRDAVTVKLLRNRLINGAMQISQENGDTAGTVVNSYPADMWLTSFVGGAHSMQRVISLTPRKSQRRLRWTVTTALATLAAGSYFGWFQRIEGITVPDFGWGAAGAKQIIVRFGFKGPTGTYSFSIRNAAANRSYVRNFTVAANVDTEQVFVIPGDVTGTWAVDNTIGLALTWAMAAGSTYNVGANGAWAAGNFLAAPGNTNGMATAGGVFEIFDVGVYLDSVNLGVPPLWEMPDEASELLACQRYYVENVYTHLHAACISAGVYYTSMFAPVKMRILPSTSVAPLSVGTNWSNTNFPATVGALAAYDERTFRENRTANASGSGFYGTNWAINARL